MLLVMSVYTGPEVSLDMNEAQWGISVMLPSGSDCTNSASVVFLVPRRRFLCVYGSAYTSGRTLWQCFPFM